MSKKHSSLVYVISSKFSQYAEKVICGLILVNEGITIYKDDNRMQAMKLILNPTKFKDLNDLFSFLNYQNNKSDLTLSDIKNITNSSGFIDVQFYKMNSILDIDEVKKNYL